MKKYLCVAFYMLLSPAILLAGTYSGGSGTSGDPYQISNMDDLSELSQTTGDWNKYFILTNDIDASQTQYWDVSDDNTDGDLYNDPNDSNSTGNNEGWPGIGNTSDYFDGTFDGNNFEISNLTTNRSTEHYHGFFGYLREATISDLGIVSVDLNGKGYMGALAGSAIRTNISNCYASGSIQATYPYVGGLVGLTYGANGPPDGIITDCNTNCTISCESNYVGGLVGINGSRNEIYNSYSIGSVDADGDYIGGLVGENRDKAKIYRCYAGGSVTGESHIGGLVGYNNVEAWITDSYSYADVHVSDMVGTATDAAGFCGRNYNSNIRYCYSTGSVINDHAAVDDPEDKGFLGEKSGVMSVYLDNNFFDHTLSNQSSDGENAATAKSTIEMLDLSTFTDETTSGLDNAWDFIGAQNDDSAGNDYWDMDDGGSRPYLSWQNRNITWLGNNTSWDNSNNWDGSMEPPTKYKNVIIASTANDPVLQSGDMADCYNLTVQAGATLTLNNGASLMTYNTISNAGTINVNKSIDQNDQWHFIASPNNNSTASVFSGFYLQEWDETSASWQDIVAAATPLSPLKGYSLFDTPAKTIFSFSGTPNNGELSYSLTYHDNPGSYDGINLLGNPYPSSIDWDLVDSEYGTVYVWNPVGNDFIERTAGGIGEARYIAPMQGFMVSTTTDKSFTISNDARTHTGATTFYKSSGSDILNGLVLSTNQMDKLFIQFQNNASNYFDFELDAKKLVTLGNDNSQIYSKYDGSKFAVDCRPETDIIKLGYQNKKSGQYSIEIVETNGITNVVLEDTKLNRLHDLSNSTYEFNWDSGDPEERFILHINKTGVGSFNEEAIKIYVHKGILNIFSNEGIRAEYQVNIYDLSGRLIHTEQLGKSKINQIDLSRLTGIYMVNVFGKNSLFVRKVVL